MQAVDIHEAKAQLAKLVDKAASGEDVVISRNGKPLVRITRLAPPTRRLRELEASRAALRRSAPRVQRS